LKFKEVFKKVACDNEGNLKKAILHNSSEIQQEILDQFVIQKLEEGDVFSFKKVKKVNLEAPDCEEEEEEYGDYDDDEDEFPYIFQTKEDLIRREKRDKIIQSCKSYVYLRENPKLFTKEEMETLRYPNIENLSEENFQRLHDIYKKFDAQLLNKQINENMKLMSSSTIENQEDISMKEAYDHMYLKEEKKRIKKELLVKENLERE
jgi:sarcosine oxidase delta subunit